MSSFFEMGGYAAYVWPAYAASALVLGGLAAAVTRRNARVREELARVEARVELRRREADRKR